ncbi:Pyridoxamine 5'-phosphate oxidase family protein ustO [Hypsizygus marmoreus]|uniref:Pyridoxamine 5'-phosphate oxidase family protein ustO n=1 Tax=Hypsizygus marmoreus TaxID=39966 RepID=A0A369K606_HYPMA|nr:Pyridoxamine 5'-phosphate oxidase family protein ustO [Hypsizygus marmoreus]
MVKYYDEIPEFLFKWIAQQKVFWVATAPLTSDGLVNISPKGVEGSFRVEGPNKVWYEDLTGSGIETVAHVRENGRITVLFNAFEGPPRILRLYGKGTVYEFGTPEYEALLPPEKRQIGSRSIIMLDVFKVGTSCGYAVPFFTYKAPRNRLLTHFTRHELADIEAEAKIESCSIPPRPENGLKQYWVVRNAKSLDGLPGVLSGFESTTRFKSPKRNLQQDDETERIGLRIGEAVKAVVDLKLVVAFFTGVMVTASYVKCVRPWSP